MEKIPGPCANRSASESFGRATLFIHGCNLQTITGLFGRRNCPGIIGGTRLS
jgi:hypothetical protein